MTLNDFIRLHLDLVNLKINKKKSNVCLNKECNKRSYFNYKNYISINIRKYIYCKIHKLSNMIDIEHKKCITCNNIQPTFNYNGEKIALYCKECKLKNMIDIKHKCCIICNTKRPNFNYISKKIALYCGDCKLPGMIDIKHKQCIICNEKQPNFNYISEKIALYCGDCKLLDMIDIKHKKCIICNDKQPIFNYENENISLYCKDCKLQNMVDIKNKKCINCNDKNPVFNYEDKKIRLYCKDCKLENMIDIKNKRCKTDLCDIQISNKQYTGYCLRCFIYNFPDSKIIRDYGTREAKVSEFIKESYKNLNITYNKIIDGGCSKNRPDIFIDCLTHSVIIEIDENQHKNNNSYNSECELRRLNNLFTDLADRPIIFIRFNPDSYINNKNKIVKSCFEYTEDRGLPKVNKTLQTRLKKLKEIIDENLNKVPNDNITTIKLYYDRF